MGYFIMKLCVACTKKKPLKDFPIRKSCSDGYSTHCRLCTRERDKSYRKTYVERNPEARKDSVARYNQSAKKLKANRKWRFQITDEDVQAMLESQGGVCGLCTREFSNGETFIDHDHACCPNRGKKTCGKCIRKILCRACNQGLGLLQDNPELLRQAADYIEHFRKQYLV